MVATCSVCNKEFVRRSAGSNMVIEELNNTPVLILKCDECLDKDKKKKEEITDLEAGVLKDYSDEFNKIVKKGNMNTGLTALCMSWTTYFHALCVKYGQNPFDVQIDNKTKKWEPITDTKK